MLIYLIFLFLCIKNLSGQFKCPADFGLFSDPQRCTHYYECENFLAISKACGSGLFFNQNQNICDWPSNVDKSLCSKDNPSIINSIRNSPKDNVNSNHITFFCHADGLYEDPVSCEHFVECANGSPFRKVCPSGLYYDKRIKACNWPESIVCAMHHDKPLTTVKPKTTKFPVITPSNHVTLPNYDGNKPSRVTNPPQHIQTEPATIAKPTENNNCEWCFKCSSKIGNSYHENKYDKTTYYHCFLGNAYLMYCPRYSVWIQEKQICEEARQSLDKNHNTERIIESTSYISIDPFSDNKSDDGTGLIDARINKKNLNNRRIKLNK